ncbi:hypothetical protein LguiB_006612 [Lonicera macranthoides]
MEESTRPEERKQDELWFCKEINLDPLLSSTQRLSLSSIHTRKSSLAQTPEHQTPEQQIGMGQGISPALSQSSQLSSVEFDSGEFGGGSTGDEQARTLKRPRLVWTPQLHKRFVDAVAHLGIKNAVPKTIMQLMSVDGLTRENVASHLYKYRLYLKRMEGISSGGGGVPRGILSSGDAATDHLFASSPVPAHFLQPVRHNSDQFLPFMPVPALQHHHHQQMSAAAAAGAGHLQLQPQYRQMGHFGSPPNGQFEHPFLARQHLGMPVNNTVPTYVEDLESPKEATGRKVLTLFPTGDD